MALEAANKIPTTISSLITRQINIKKNWDDEKRMILPLKIFLFPRSKKIFWNLISTLLSVLEKCLKTCKSLKLQRTADTMTKCWKFYLLQICPLIKISNPALASHPHWERISNKRRRWIFSPGLWDHCGSLEWYIPGKEIEIQNFPPLVDNRQFWVLRDQNLIKSDRWGCWRSPAQVWWSA